MTKNADCVICTWTPEEKSYPFIYESRYWRVVLAANQILLGRCVVHLKRHAGDLADLTNEEVLEWLPLVRKLEKAIRISFGASMFNWSCLMNHAFREEKPNPHVHWWAGPRYKQAVLFKEQKFEDTHFGNPFDHDRTLELPEDVHLAIARKIATAINTPD